MIYEGVVLNYLRNFPGQYVRYWGMLNVLTNNIACIVYERLKVSREEKRRVAVDLMRATSRLRKQKVIKTWRSKQVNKQPRRYLIRINEAFVRKSVL